MAVMIISQSPCGRNQINMESGYLLSNRYRIDSLISEGSTALVYKGYDIISNNVVAIKVMKKDFYVQNNRHDNFDKEARCLASLRHINIIRIEYYGYEDHLPYLVEEFSKGKTLSECLDTYGPYQLKEVKSIMEQVLTAVEYIHTKGLLHCDIKPQNIFYSADGLVKISDFGLSSTLNENYQSCKVNGSVPYLAPEMIMGKPPSVESDIYALGATFYELLEGKIPFNGHSYQDICQMHLNEPFPLVAKNRTPLYEKVNTILRKACAKNPLDRYHNVHEMYLDILHLDVDNPPKKRKGFFHLFRRHK